jgi:hypothetical protein
MGLSLGRREGTRHYQLNVPDKIVPAFQVYFPSVAMMSEEQRKFYKLWRENLNDGVALEIGQNISYVFCYCYEVIATGNIDLIYEEMKALAAAYKANEKVSLYCGIWANDALVCRGDFQRSIEEFVPLPLDRIGSMQTDRLLSLKLILGMRMSGKDVLTLDGPSVTKYARSSLSEVAEYVDIQLRAEDAAGTQILKVWLKEYQISTTGYWLFAGTIYSRELDKVRTYWFSRCGEVLKFCRDITREAENSFREEKGMPRVGEGWISETQLYYEIKSAFGDCAVKQHGRPGWLRGQHLDVYIEEMRVAIEYQGAQHDNPVAYFGGEEGFRRTQERDARKARLCKKHGVSLIYVREGYNLLQVITEIRAAAILAG